MWPRSRRPKIRPGEFVPVASLVVHASTHSAKDFDRLYPPHALLFDACKHQVERSTFRTLHRTEQTSAAEPAVVFLATSAQPISIGRAENSGVVLRVDGISRLHALLITHPAPRIMDAGSSFGTAVDGEALRPNEFVPLRPTSTIQLADLSATYFSSESLHEYLLMRHRIAS